MFFNTYYNSPIGKILLVSDEKSLIGAWFEGQKYYLGNLKEKLYEKDNVEILSKTKLWLDKYFSKKSPCIDELSLAPIGSEFRQCVWKILCKIPYGKTTTYGNIAKEVAKKLNKPTMSAQAIGGAVGHNPISIIIPCHRVVGSDKHLIGYAGGIDKKINLLSLEGVNVNSFSLPKVEDN